MRKTEILFIVIAVALAYIWWRYGTLTKAKGDIGQYSLTNPQYG